MNTIDFSNKEVREVIRKAYNEYANSDEARRTYEELGSFDKAIEELIDQTGMSEDGAYEDMYAWLICGCNMEIDL